MAVEAQGSSESPQEQNHDMKLYRINTSYMTFLTILVDKEIIKFQISSTRENI